MSADGAARRSFDHALPALGRAADRLRRCEPLPGGILVACDRGGEIGRMPFGVADLERSAPVTGEELFEIGSISKVLTSVVVGQLVDRGLVRLDDAVRHHLPWIDLGRYTERVTVAHLLGHTAGLVSGADALTDEMAQAWSLRDRSSFEPGTRFHYSNVGYVLLGLLISAVTGEPHGRLLEREVLGRLGSGTAIGSIRNADRGRMAVGYAPSADDRPWLPGDRIDRAPWLEALGADGNVAMDAGALAGLLRLLLGDGEVGGSRVLSPEGMRRLAGVLAPDGEPILPGDAGLPVTASRYGLGVNVETIGGARCLTHGGGMVGYASFVLADPDRDVAVGVLTNANGDCLAAQTLARYAHRLLAGGDAVPAELGLADIDPVRRASACPPATVAGLAGTDERDGEVDVVVERVADRLRCTTSQGTGTLFRDAYGRFATDHPQLRSMFLHPAGPGSPDDAAVAVDAPVLAGHYRSHNPWLTNVRIVRRRSGLFLVGVGGVEAPVDDEALVPSPGGGFRVGAQPWRPERLDRLATVDGVAVLIDLDGCRYSRTPV